MVFFYAARNSFSCATNCQTSYAVLPNTNSGRQYNRVNPTSRFSVEAVVDGFDMTKTYFYKWDLLERENNKSNTSFAMANVPVIAADQWVSNATTSDNIRTMSLVANWYSNDTSGDPGFYLRLSFWVGDNKGPPMGMQEL